MASDTIVRNGEAASRAAEPPETARVTSSAPPASYTYFVNRQRIPATIDPLSALPTGAIGPVQVLRTSATQRMYVGLKQIQTGLQKIATPDHEQKK